MLIQDSIYDNSQFCAAESIREMGRRKYKKIGFSDERKSFRVSSKALKDTQCSPEIKEVKES